MIIILLFAVISFLLNKGGMTKILSYLLLPNKRCSQRNSSPHHSQLSKNMKSYFCQFLAICSELSSLRHNLIHGVPKLTPRDSLHSLQNIKSYFACLLVICSELSSLRHNLILERLFHFILIIPFQKSNSFQNPLFCFIINTDFIHKCMNDSWIYGH